MNWTRGRTEAFARERGAPGPGVAGQARTKKDATRSRAASFLPVTVVPKRGFEPLQAHCPLDPEPSVSTNSTTSAHDPHLLPLVEGVRPALPQALSLPAPGGGKLK